MTNATLRCAILDDYQQVAMGIADWGRLRERVRVDSFSTHLDDHDMLVERLSGYDVVVAMRERTPFPESLLERLPRLKLLVTAYMANASIDMAAARRLGIDVCGTRGVTGPAAELAWALLLTVARNLPAEVANLRGGGSQWQVSLGTTLSGKTLGVAGIGRLGQLVAGYGRAFGMNVLGWSRNNTPERSAALGIQYSASLDDLLMRSDVVSLHLLLTQETRGLIGARELGLMKPGAILINTSRGPLVDEKALIAALEAGHLGGAGLDVFDHEPLATDHPFRTLGNVVATPHIGFVTREAYRVYYGDAVESIEAWLAGSPVRLLNPAGVSA